MRRLVLYGVAMALTSALASPAAERPAPAVSSTDTGTPPVELDLRPA